MRKRLWAASLLVLVGIALLAAPPDAPARPDAKNGSVGWRNDGTGQFPASSPPQQWSGDKNVLWKVALPGSSYATPIVVGEHLYVASDPAELLCVRLADGKVLWRKANGDIKAPQAPRGGFGGPGGFGMGNPLPKSLLKALDTDKDGKLSRDELVAGVKRFFKDADKDKKGTLDEKALAAALNRIVPQPRFGRPGGGGPGGRPGGFGQGTMLAGAIFKRAEPDKDGKVTEAKLIAAAEKLFKEVDKDRKGKLDESAVAAGVAVLSTRPAFGGRGGFGGRPGGFGGGGFGPGSMLAGAIVKRAEPDKAGKVTEARLIAAAEKLFKEADKEKTGKLDESAVTAGINLLSGRGGSGRPGGGAGGFGPGNFFARPLLEALDSDKDGKLSRDELVAGVKRFFKDNDKDKKGTLDEKAITEGLNRIAPQPRFGRGGPGGGPGGGRPGGGGPGGFGMGGMSAGNSAATPVSDGKHVALVLGNGVVAVYDLQGKRLWGRFVESPQLMFGHAASPLLLDGKVIVHIKDLVALDVATGKEAWRVTLPPAHASPVGTRLGKDDVVISPAGVVVRARDGKVLGRGEFHSSQSSPVVLGDTVYVFGRTLEAHRLAQNDRGEVTFTALWSHDGAGEMHHIPSPVLHEGLLYGVTTAGILHVLDAKTGDTVYRQRLNIGQVYSSVTLAGGLLYVVALNGKAVVFKPGQRFVRVATNDLEGTGSCPVFSGDRLYLRGQKNLYCLGSTGPTKGGP